MKLELKHLAIGYAGKTDLIRRDGLFESLNIDLINCSLHHNGTTDEYYLTYKSVTYSLYEVFPHRRPLSSLTKEIEHKGQKGCDIFMPTRILMCPTFKFCADKEELLFNLQSSESIERCPYNVVQKLLEWNFDIFGLLDKGLAIEKP